MQQIQTIDLEDFADLYSESSIINTTRIGNTKLHTVTHPTRGNLILIDTGTSEAGFINLN
ncbi:hypothetical protein B0G62_103466 [Paraburkholderia eburnea]|uniref:Uncharacterized protein n=1 Tax=Paraburkholderia eburnea TaxID=1189126 RepID=A0A2S4MGK8_9BURK|nr:hypothetical protein [Paraburkholderia eburnea]POR53884.1 hypothetical protein B0G62_103466 [Paraburkholderia eburnea]PRZ25852.1 hypothetical protein BX588_102466 [Paraburkholderia eburnea]